MTQTRQRKVITVSVIILVLNFFVLGCLFEIAYAAFWTSAGQMNSDRVEHTATLMAGGHVLMAGGSASADAQLVDPISGGGPGSAMILARQGHTATLLPNGKVLVTGGGLSTGGSDTTEIYDPSTNSWSFAASMSANRELHTATLLSDGKVLITGGCDTLGNPLSSAEIYDSAANSWSPAEPMTATRCFHTATRLLNGHVLVTGGIGLPSAEIYDPATNSWSSAASMSANREAHTATLLPNGHVFVAGGFSATAESYDPGTNSWLDAGSMSATREEHSATLLLTGQVLVAGGRNNAGDPLATSDTYDPASNSWILPDIMNSVRVGHTATLLSDGKVLVAGGGSAIMEMFTPPGPVNLPDITVIPTSVDFGLISLNSSAAQLVTVKNDGALNLTIGGVTFGGVSLNQFSKAADKCSRKTLTPGASCTVDLRFKPTTIGGKTATFIIPSTDPDENPFAVLLSGTGVSRR
jgi:N-acetylneuraminic acid mutarotase